MSRHNPNPARLSRDPWSPTRATRTIVDVRADRTSRVDVRDPETGEVFDRVAFEHRREALAFAAVSAWAIADADGQTATDDTLATLVRLADADILAVEARDDGETFVSLASRNGAQVAIGRALRDFEVSTWSIGPTSRSASLAFDIVVGSWVGAIVRRLVRDPRFAPTAPTARPVDIADALRDSTTEVAIAGRVGRRLSIDTIDDARTIRFEVETDIADPSLVDVLSTLATE